MADNYLEKKMEDLRAGRLATPTAGSRHSVQTRGGAKRGFVEFPFPPRRVLVTGGAGGIGLDIVRGFLKTGSKVSVFDTDEEKGTALAYKEGIRFYHVDVTDPDAFEFAFTSLLKAWRDVDIIVTAIHPATASVIAHLWTTHRDRFPIPFGYPGRLIMLGNKDYKLTDRLHVQLSPYRIPVYDISDNDSELPRLCLFLSLPLADSLCKK